jgi:anti-anti-sigma regulatory factor
MSSSLVEVQQNANEGEFDVLTSESDTARANLRARGTLDSSSAPLLAEVIAGHVRARRRFLRLDVANLVIADLDALDILRQAHHFVLRARGTLILTRVTDALRTSLARAGLDRELFIVPPSSHEAGMCAD